MNLLSACLMNKVNRLFYDFTYWICRRPFSGNEAWFNQYAKSDVKSTSHSLRATKTSTRWPPGSESINRSSWILSTDLSPGARWAVIWRDATVSTANSVTTKSVLWMHITQWQQAWKMYPARVVCPHVPLRSRVEAHVNHVNNARTTFFISFM